MGNPKVRFAYDGVRDVHYIQNEQSICEECWLNINIVDEMPVAIKEQMPVAIKEQMPVAIKEQMPVAIKTQNVFFSNMLKTYCPLVSIISCKKIETTHTCNNYKVQIMCTYSIIA